MPTPSTNDDFTEFHFYTDKDFKVIMQAFDILSKYDANVLNTDVKLSKKLKTNGCRSFVLRVFIIRYVLKHYTKIDSDSRLIIDKEFADIIDTAIEKQIDKYKIS